MKHSLVTKIFSIGALLGIGCAGQLNAGLYEFKPSSVLASGQWVKVRVAETGIYEITYRELRDMGFANPSNVGVYGKGGTSLPFSFTDGKEPQMTDDLSPVAVWHDNDRLYFYGRGVEEIVFNPSDSRFERESLNLYAIDGAYFLTDKEAPLSMQVYETPEDNIKAYTGGFDYVYHENDIFQNTTETGQIFWGESLLENPDMKWPLSLPLINLEKKASLECRVYAADKSTGTFRYGVTDASTGNRSFAIKHPVAASGSRVNPEFMHMANPVISLQIPDNDFELYNKVEDGSGDFINLDYWIFTYPKLLPDSTMQTPQERLSVKVSGTQSGVLALPVISKTAVFDVSDPALPALLPYATTEEAVNYYFPAGVKKRDFIVCDLSKTQKKVSGVEKLSNTDLHAMASKGADMLIITVPEYQDFANRLAELHRVHEGMSVEVALTSDIYNEFSGGVPDPMAYRGIIKMMADSDSRRFRNVLLVGKVFGDFRKILRESDENYIIGFQENKVNAETEAGNVMDYYGYTADKTESKLHNNKMQVGIGILPLHSQQDGEIYLKKVERYITDRDKASIVNEFLSIGGHGDNHTHDRQAVLLKEHQDLYGPQKQVTGVIATDAYGEKAAKKKLLDDMRYGKLISTYLGHGTSFGLVTGTDFFSNSDLPTLNNPKQGFIFIYGCDLSHTDKARKGFGELVVTGSDNGMVGSIMATRTVWSGQNFELGKLLISNLYASPDKVADAKDPNTLFTAYRSESPTIGEVYSAAKSQSTYANSLSYMLVGDPSLRIPVPLRRISVSTPPTSYKGGSTFNMKGSVLIGDTIHLKDSRPIDSYSLPVDKSYNGKVIAKLTAPVKDIESKDYITDTSATGKTLTLPSPHIRLAEFTGEVKEGNFELTITIPEEADIYEGEDLQLYISAYDPDKVLAAAGYAYLQVDADLAEGSIDEESPVVETSFDPALSMIKISVTDNAGVRAQGITASIDDNAVSTFALGSGLEAGPSAEAVAYTDEMTPGKYTLKVTATDLAGNKTETESEITIPEYDAPLILSSDCKAATDKILFSVTGASTKSLILIVTDSEGTVQYKKALDGDSFLWNLSDEKETQLAPGLYRAKVESDPAEKSVLFSKWLYFAILE